MNLRDIMAKTLLQRTGYKANDGGKIISGCTECTHNLVMSGILAKAPGHFCNLTVQKRLILDPYNIPIWCPLKVDDPKEAL